MGGTNCYEQGRTLCVHVRMKYQIVLSGTRGNAQAVHQHVLKTRCLIRHIRHCLSAIDAVFATLPTLTTIRQVLISAAVQLTDYPIAAVATIHNQMHRKCTVEAGTKQQKKTQLRSLHLLMMLSV